MTLPRDLFPSWYAAPLPPVTFQQVIVLNWLDIELDNNATKTIPALATLSHHRNREVHRWVGDHQDWIERWTAETYGGEPYQI